MIVASNNQLFAISQKENYLCPAMTTRINEEHVEIWSNFTVHAEFSAA